MMVMAAFIGAGLGIERCLERRDRGAEAADHVRDHVVGADEDAAGEKLNREVAVAEVPGDTHERVGARGADIEQVFGPGNDADDAAPLEAKAIALAEAMGRREVDEEIGPGFGCENETTAMAAVEIDPHAIHLLIPWPGAGRKNLARAHG
jgi:hypothetical protein